MKNVHLDGGARALPRPFFFFFLFFFVFFEHTEGVVRDRKARGATLNVPSMPRGREKEYPLKFIPAFPRTGRYLGRNKVSRHFERICLVAGILSDISALTILLAGLLQFREYVVSCNFMRIARLYLRRDSRFECSRRRMEMAYSLSYIKPLTKKGFIKNASTFLSFFLSF